MRLIEKVSNISLCGYRCCKVSVFYDNKQVKLVKNG